MKINNINSTNFTAIYIKNTNIKELNKVSLIFASSGLEYRGNKNAYFSIDKVNEIKKFIRSERQRILRNDPFEFISIYLPWNREAYFLSTPKNEQFMYNMLENTKYERNIEFLL